MYMCGECGKMGEDQELKTLNYADLSDETKGILSLGKILEKNGFIYIACPDCTSHFVFFDKKPSYSIDGVKPKRRRKKERDKESTLKENDLLVPLEDRVEANRKPIVFEAKCSVCNKVFNTKAAGSTRCMECLRDLVPTTNEENS